MAISNDLGQQHEVTLPQGTISYRERGTGDPIVFVHGALVNADLWRKVVPRLAKDHRCIAPDLPLGSHERPLPADADLSPPAAAKLIADFIAALELENVTLVGNDTGGALCQLVVTRHPERIGRLVLTNCDAYDKFPPSFFRYLFLGAHIPGFVTALFQPMRIKANRNSPIAYGWLAKRGIPAEITKGWVQPGLHNRAVRRDTAKLLKGAHPRYTQEAAARFGEFDKPVLIAWGQEKDFFPKEYGERLARDFPQGRLERIEDSYTFVPEDQPERLAQLIAEFAREPAGSAGVTAP
jgi:pimeloyl-ACP methyl ester carboxylesterase